MIPVDSWNRSSRNRGRGRGMKESSGGGKFKYDIFDIF
jgi:hypothetical protein